MTLSQVGKKTMNVMGMMKTDDYNLSTKHGLGGGDQRFKHGVTEETRPLAKLPGDVVNHPLQSFPSLLPSITP